MSYFGRLNDAESKGIGCAACTIISTSGTTPRAVGSKMIVYENGDLFGSIGGGSVEQEVREEALRAIKSQTFIKRIFTIDSQSKNRDDHIEIFIEPVLPQVNLLIFGVGHIGKQVASFGKQMGWHTVIIDDRAELCSTANIPYGDEFIIGFSEKSLDQLQKQNGYFILTTRNSEIDLMILKSILKKNYRFIGVLGSLKRWGQTKNGLLSNGFLETEIDKIYAPIGLEINAETPEEIAISIISQIIMIRNNGK
jgi:xanthine dehydrogenase accessory factor